jgi:hypothetical protein
MKYTDIMLGSQGHAAQGFTRATICGQLGFLVSQAALQTEKKNDTPQYDADIVEAMGDNGLPQAVVLDLKELVYGYAAAFHLLTKHVNTPNPETGRKDLHLVDRFLRTPKKLIQTGVDFRLNGAIRTLEATAGMVVDSTKEKNETYNACSDEAAKAAWVKLEISRLVEPRANVLKQEAAARVTTVTAPIDAMFVAALKDVKDVDEATWCDIALEALTNAERDPAAEIKRSAIVFIESQKKRMQDGKFVRIDPGIYALAK